MNYKKLNYDKKEIEREVLKIKSDEEKMSYFLYLRKELEIVIYTFENTCLLKYRLENNNCDFRKASELAKFIEDLKIVVEEEQCDELNKQIVEMKQDVEKYFYKTSYYKNYYSKEPFEVDEYVDDDIMFGIMEIGKWVEEELKKYKMTQKYIQTEIDYLKEKKLIKYERPPEKMKNNNEGSKPNTNKFNKLWNNLINAHFKTDIFIGQLEEIGDDKGDEYIEYCVKKFQHRTIIEWMKYYERLDKASQYKTLDDSNLPPEDDYRNRMRINNAKFEESTLGQYTLGNLQLFESKYVLQNYGASLPNIIGIFRSIVKQYIYQRKPVRELISNIESGIDSLEIMFERDVDEFPEELKTEIETQKAKLKEARSNLENIDLKLWGNFSKTNEGLIWKHDRLVREYKRIMVGDDSLFSELENKETDRWNNMMKQKIIKMVGDTNKTLNEDELDDIILNVLEIRLSDNEVILEEIINPEIADQNVQKVINQVLIDKKIINKNSEIINASKRIEKLLDGLTEADTVEEKIYKDIEYWENFSRLKDRGTDDIWIGESWLIARDMLRTFINDLKQAKITGYYKGKKIDFIAADRLNKFLHEVIKEIETRNEKNEIVEMAEVNIEEVKTVNTDKKIDVNQDESELPVDENEKQRDKIKQFLLANYKDFDTNLLLNVNGIAYEITDFYYPKLTKPERKKKKESLRQELMLFRNGKIPLK